MNSTILEIKNKSKSYEELKLHDNKLKDLEVS